VADALDLLREDSGALRILDVGGAEGVILDFLPEDEVTILDQAQAEGVPNFVVGDATALPFDDDAFDYGVSVDVYEHIGEGAREKYLAELRRVARKGVLLAAPFDSEAVRGTERLANEFHRSVHLQENQWLEEHAENGLPDLSWSRGFFEDQGDRVTVLPNGYLPHWLAMISLTFYSAHLRDGMEGMAERLNAYYNEFLYRHDNAEPSYRHLVVSLKEDRDVDFQRLTSPESGHPDTNMSAALFSTFSSTLSLAPQLKDLSRQLAEKERRLSQKDRQLSQKDRQLSQKDAQLSQKDRQLSQKDDQGSQKDEQLSHKDAQLAQREGQLSQKEAQIKDLSRRLAQQTVTANRIAALNQENAGLKQQRN
ncbi:MAG: methyltransferase domain-containing protein, partial [Rubrobacter sp.]